MIVVKMVSGAEYCLDETLESLQFKLKVAVQNGDEFLKVPLSVPGKHGQKTAHLQRLNIEGVLE